MSDQNPQDPKEPGEFTRLFGVNSTPPETPASGSPRLPADKANLPGDETVLQPLKLDNPQRAVRPQPQRPDRLARPSAADGRQNPGEFTRIFRGAEAFTSEPPPAAAATGSKTAEPGEFTRFFQAPPASPVNAQREQAPATPVPVPPKPAGPAPLSESEFTRYFKTPQMPAGREVDWKAVEAQPAASDSSKPPGEFTHLFGPMAGPPTPGADKGSLPRSTQEAEPARGASVLRSVPSYSDQSALGSSVISSEFDKVFARPSQPAHPAPPAQGTAPAASDKAPAPGTGLAKPPAPSLAILFGIIGLILLLAAVAVYFLVLRK